MDLGDLVLYKKRRWLVERFSKMARTAYLRAQNGDVEELPDKLDLLDPATLRVLTNPSRQWKVLTAGIKSGAGPFVKLVVPGVLGRQAITLIPWGDWIPSDLSREGGSVFIRPGLKISAHTIVLLTHRNGTSVRVKVPAVMRTVAQQRDRLQPKTPEPEIQDRFSRMMEDD